MSSPSRSSTRFVEMLREGAEHLKRADQFVRDRKFENALSEIEKARGANPNNLYAMAYEERVRSLINITASGREELSGTVLQNQSLPEDFQPALEQLSRLAVAQAQRALEMEMKKEQERQALMDAAEEGRRFDEIRKKAIEERTELFIANASEFQAKNELELALSELGRVFVLDPENERAKILSSEILQGLKEQEDVRERKIQDEERRRREFLKIELAKLEQQIKEKHKDDQLDRRDAQTMKVKEYLNRCKQLLSEGRTEEAINHIAFVAVVDPLNPEIQAMGLEEKIRRRMEYDRDDKPRTGKGFELQKLSIKKHLEAAEALLARRRFTEALRVVTRAFLINPLSEEVQQCERKILEAREKSALSSNAEKKTFDESQWKAREFEWKRIETAERERFQRQVKINTEARQRMDEEKIQYYLSRAWNHLQHGRFENALGEIALAYLVNPYDEEVKLLEEQIVSSTQTRPQLDPRSSLERVMNGKSGGSRSTDSEPELRRDDVLALEPKIGQLQNHLESARKLIIEQRMEESLNELTQAFRIDPLNNEVKDLEHYVRTRLERATSLRTSAGNQGLSRSSNTAEKIRNHLAKAKSELSLQRYDTALGEIALAFVLDPLDEEVKRVEEEVLLARARNKQTRSPQIRPSKNMLEQQGPAQIARHLAAADEFRSKGEYSKALEEIARAFVIDPLNESILRLDSQIQSEFQEQRRQKRT